MSQATKDVWMGVYRGVIIILLTVCGYFLERTFNTFNETRESVIRLEVNYGDFKEKVNENLHDMKQDIHEIKQNMK